MTISHLVNNSVFLEAISQQNQGIQRIGILENSC